MYMYTHIKWCRKLTKYLSFCLIVGYLMLTLLLVIRNYDIFDAIFDYHYKRFAKIERLPFLKLLYNNFLIHIQCKHLFKGMRKVDDIAFKISFNSNCNPHICMLQAFAELQAKMIDTQQKVKLADLQIEQLSRMKKHANLTHGEITALPNSTRMYEGAGRMYVHFCWCKICPE